MYIYKQRTNKQTKTRDTIKNKWVVLGHHLLERTST